VLWSYSDAKSYGSSLINFDVLGHRGIGWTSGTINELAGIGVTVTPVYGSHVAFNPKTISTLQDGNVVVSGTKLGVSGTPAGGSSETIIITADTSAYYISANRWIGSVGLNGDQPFSETMSIVTDGLTLVPFNHGRMIKTMEAAFVKWRPSSTTWTFAWSVYKVTAGASGGVIALPGFPRTFNQTGSPVRAASGSFGTDHDYRIDATVDPSQGEGFIIEVGVKNIDSLNLWASFYEY